MPRLSQTLVKDDYITDGVRLLEVKSVSEGLFSGRNAKTGEYVSFDYAYLDRKVGEEPVWRLVVPA